MTQTASEAARSWIFDPQRDETSHRSALTSGHRTMLVTVEELTALLESRETAERERAARVAGGSCLGDKHPYHSSCSPGCHSFADAAIRSLPPLGAEVGKDSQRRAPR